MKKYSFYGKIISSAAAAALVLSTAASSAFAVDNLKGRSYADMTPQGEFSMWQIENSPNKPYIVVDSKVLKVDEAAGRTVQVKIRVDNADDCGACGTGILVYYDPRLTVQVDDTQSGAPGVEYRGNITETDANGFVGTYLMVREDPTAEEKSCKGLYLCTASREPVCRDGMLWTINFQLPYDTKSGDVFPIDLLYRYSPAYEPLFTNKLNDEEGKLMTAWTFTYGIYNKEYNDNFAASAEDILKCSALSSLDRSYDGYIAIEDDYISVTTTAYPTTTTTTSTTTATTPVTTETTAAPATTTTSTTSTTTATTTTTTETTTTTAMTTTTEATEPPVTAATTVTMAPDTTAPVTTTVPVTTESGELPETGYGRWYDISAVAAAFLAAGGAAVVLRNKRRED